MAMARSLVVPRTWDLPQDLQGRIAGRVGRQRAIVSEGHLLLVLCRVPRPGRPERDGTLFWRAPSGDWMSNQGSGGLNLLRQHVAAYESAVDVQEAELEKADSAIKYYEILQSISPLNRAANNLHAALRKAREAIREDAELGSMTDWAYEVSRAADLVHIDARNAIDYELARQASLQAEAGRRLAIVANRLNVVAALFLPLTALASVFGMNLRSGLNHDAPGTFWMVLSGGLLLGVLVLTLIVVWGVTSSPRRRGRKRE